MSNVKNVNEIKNVKNCKIDKNFKDTYCQSLKKHGLIRGRYIPPRRMGVLVRVRNKSFKFKSFFFFFFKIVKCRTNNIKVTYRGTEKETYRIT